MVNKFAEFCWLKIFIQNDVHDQGQDPMDAHQTLNVQSAALGHNVHVYHPDHAVGSRRTDGWKFNKLK